MAASLRTATCVPAPPAPGSARLGSRSGQPRLARFLHSPSFNGHSSLRIRASGEGPRSAHKTRAASVEVSPPVEEDEDSRVLQVHSREEFDLALKNAKKKLVVVEYAASHSKNSAKIYPALVNLSRQAPDADFLLVMGDESEELATLCQDMGVKNVPHFVFYKDGVKVHEEEGISPDQLYSDVLYYGDSETPVKQLHSKEDFLGLVKEHMEDQKLVVIDMTLNNCGPCARVYPTVVNLSHQMEESVVFARMIGNENDSCKEMMKAFKVVEVPTFLFIRKGKLSGRYVGSGRGELIGEILRHQGVECT